PNFGFLPWGGIWMRMQTKDLAGINKLVDRNIDQLLENQISNGINNQWPNLSNEKRKDLINKEVENWKKTNNEEYQQALNDQTRLLKEQYRFEFNGKQYPYMPDIDPYNYVRFAENYLERGHAGDDLNKDVPWDYHTIAPLGRDANLQTKAHVIVIAYFYSFMSLFTNTHILYTTSYLPILFTLLSLILIFFITKRLSNNTGAFFATTLLSIHFMFSGRTNWGYADTDFYNVFFPLFISWLFFEAVYLKKLKYKQIFVILSSLAIAIYSITWLGWWFVFYLLIGSSGLAITYKFINKNYAPAKELTYLVLSILVLSLFFVYIFAGWNTAINVINYPFNFNVIKNASMPDLWPNVYTTVAELNEQSFGGIFDKIGWSFMILSVIGAMFLLITRKPQNILGSFYWVLWFIVTVYASTKGSRFLLLLIPAMSVLFGVGAFFITDSISKLLKKQFEVPKVLTTFILIILLSLTMVSSVKISYELVFGDDQGRIGELPLVNDAWWDALIHIKENSDENAIITSWWDFGHHFKYIADRAVTFDGSSQNEPMAHWVGKLLSTNNENEAVGLLRMLDCGSNNAFKEINEEINNTPKTVSLIYDLMKLDKNNAKKVLLNQFSEEKTNKILETTHCDPPQAFLIVSQDMISKAGVWAHFGNWNFIKADVWTNHKSTSKKQLTDYLLATYNISKESAEKIYDELQKIKSEKESEKSANTWIGDWSSYFDQNNPLADCTKQENEIICSNGFVMINETPYIMVDQNKAAPIQTFNYIDTKGNWVSKESDQKTGIDAVFLQQNGKYKSLLAQTPLAGSLFTRLFFLNGHGLKHFKLVKETNQAIGGKIIVWEIDWTGNQNNVLSGIIEKKAVNVGDTVFVNYLMYDQFNNITESSIKNWREKNIIPTVKFEDYDTSSVPLLMQESLQKEIYDALLGLKKGEDTVISLNVQESFLPEQAKKQLGNTTINIRLGVERIV
ncbi:hypothetical protein COV11_02185, partial [Candidatus Woesearchaeota archaeon CG10_big_fil_rev_8_21_14_0_10_30_7]